MNNDRENIRRDAYLKALNFKNTGLEEEAIYARLEKLGVPEDIAREVAKNVLIKKIEDKDNQVTKPINKYSIWQKLLKDLFK